MGPFVSQVYHLFAHFILFDTILVFRFQPSAGLRGAAGGVRYEGLQNLPLPPPPQGHVQAEGAQGREVGDIALTAPNSNSKFSNSNLLCPQGPCKGWAHSGGRATNIYKPNSRSWSWRN